MRKIYLILTLLLLQGNLSFSQERFVADVFNEIEKQTFAYDEAGEPFLMDIYQPKGDDLVKRPVFLFVHGGGFAGGSRDEPNHIELCNSFAKRGYVAVSIDYTLRMKGKSFSCDGNGPEKVETFLESGREVSRAVRFLLDNQLKFGVDPGRIVLVGSSAGAEAILHTAFWSKTRMDSEGNSIIENDFKFAGLINMAGAMVNVNWIDHENKIPVLSIHGTCDPLVPYEFAPHHYCDPGDSGYLLLYGSKSIHERMKSLSSSSYLYSVCGGGHEWATNPITDHHKMMAGFLFEQVINNSLTYKHQIIQSDSECDLGVVVDYCTAK